MTFVRADFDIRREIDRRVQLEAEVEWARKKTQFTPIPDHVDYGAPVPPVLALTRFVYSLRP